MRPGLRHFGSLVPIRFCCYLASNGGGSLDSIQDESERYTVASRMVTDALEYAGANKPENKELLDQMIPIYAKRLLHQDSGLALSSVVQLVAITQVKGVPVCEWPGISEAFGREEPHYSFGTHK